MPKVMAQCKLITDDEKALNAWIAQYDTTAKLEATVSLNMLLHHKKIAADQDDAKTAWKALEYFKAGVIYSDIVLKLLGPVTNPPKLEETLMFPVYAVPEFAAGFLFNFVKENDLKKVEACYQGGEADENILKNAIADFTNGDSLKGMVALKNFAEALPGLLHTCKGMETDLQAVEVWAKTFKNKNALVAKITKAMMFHHKQMSTDIANLKEEFAADDYFKAGRTAADLAETALGPVSPLLFV